MKLLREIIAPLTSCILFAGCTLGPDYQRPEMDILPAFRGDTQTPLAFDQTQNLSFGELKWWDIFRDEKLQELIKIGLSDNYSIQIAAARIAQVRGFYGITRAEQYPQLGLNIDTNRRQLSNEAEIPVGQYDLITNHKFSLDLSFELDLWGKLSRATESAQAQILSTEAAKNIVIATLVSEIAKAYFELRDLDHELEISQRTLKSREESLSLVKFREQSGAGSKLDVRQSEVLVVTAATTIPKIEAAIAQTENRLSTLLGRNPGVIPRGKSINELSYQIEVPAGLPATLLERRPDIQQAEQDLIAANAEIGVAKASFFPAISLTASAGRESDEFSRIMHGSAKLWSIGNAISLPIFNAGKLSSNLDMAEAKKLEATLSYMQSIRSAFSEVSTALVAYQKSREFCAKQQELVSVLKDAADLTKVRYEGGVSSYLEVLDTERQLFSAELTLAQAKRDELVSVVVLYKALGGGWN